MTYIEFADEIIQEGYNPIPLKKNKTPMLPVGHKFLYEPIDKVTTRFQRAEFLGIVCGQISGGFYAFDFDCHQGQNIQSVFDDFYDTEFIQNLIASDQIIFYRTPSGGFHGYIRLDEVMPGTKLCTYPDGKVMVEIRGHGQYVATHPSPGYEFIAGCDLIKLQYLERNVFNQIIILIKSYDSNPEIKPTTKNSEKRTWPDKWDEASLTGNFNNTKAEYVKSLLVDAGWHLISTRRSDGVELWQRPGKEEGISATFGAKFNMFYCFSDNAIPFKAQTAYNPFDIYTILVHNGDWKQAKDSLKPKKVAPIEPEEIVEPEDHSFFPVEVFPAFIQEYIAELNRTLNFHPDFLSAACMFSIATINGNRYKLRVKSGWDAQTIFWFACVGFPGAIKTHPVKTIINPIYQIDKSSKVMYDEEMKHYDPEAKPRQPKPRFKQILISDYTIEALHSIHDINTRGIGLYKDELVGFLNDMNKYRKGSDEQFWLESFNNGTHIVNRVSKEPIMIHNICINLIGTIQHDVLNKIITDYAGNGLIDRFLFTSSENKVYPLTDVNIQERFTETWSKIIHKMDKGFFYTDTNHTELVQMTPEAFKVYQEIDARYVTIQNAEDASQDHKNYLSKMKTYVPRFALLLAIMDSIFDDDYIMVDVKQMVDAGKIADYFIKTATRVFSNNLALKDINEVTSSLKGKTTQEKVLELLKRGFKSSAIIPQLKISRQHYYRLLKK